jgi:tetratricopeptide (TPR) repeat protein
MTLVDHSTHPGSSMRAPTVQDVDSAEFESPAIGKQLGGYRLTRWVGAGGMGVVFEAEPVGGGASVALKYVPAVEPNLLYRFKHEFRALEGIVHDNLVELGELVVLPDGRAFYTMELIDGRPFVGWVRKRTPSGSLPNLHRLERGLRQLLAGILHLHRNNCLHRDLKPSNVLVTREGRVVILDFGLVFELATIENRLTADGQMVGTPAYMAPEQVASVELGPAADIYAVGVILFECLTGCLPFAGPQMQMLLRKQDSDAPDPAELVSGIPPLLRELCRSMLHRDPTKRPTAEAVLERLISGAESATEHDAERATIDDRGIAFVGRAAERAALEAAYAELRDHAASSAVLLSGPNGRGKSALAVEVLRSIHERDGAVVLHGRCHERESVPYKGLDAMVDALYLHLRRLPAYERASFRPRHLAALERVFPILAGLWPRDLRTPRARADPSQIRTQGAAALRDILVRLGDRLPLVVFIDDFQWADVDSLRVLGELLLPPEPPTLLLVLAFRDESRTGVLATLTDPDVLRTRIVTLRLEPLAHADAVTLARSLLERRPDRLWSAEELDTGAQLIAEAAAGEPLQIVRAVRAAMGAGEVRSVDEMLARQIVELPTAALHLLALIALARGPLDESVLLDALGLDMGPELIARLQHEGLIRTIAGREGPAFELAHTELAELGIGELEAGQLPALHLALAEALERRGASPQLLALHFERGGRLDHAAALTAEAADDAAAALAFAKAVELYRRALELSSDVAARASLLAKLAEQLPHIGRNDEAARTWIELAGLLPDRAPELRLRAAEQFAIAGSSAAALPLLEEQLHSVGERMPRTKLGALLTFFWNRLRLWLRGAHTELRRAEEIEPSKLRHLDMLLSTSMAFARQEFLLAMAIRPRAIRLAFDLGERRRLATLLGIEASSQAAMCKIAAAQQTLARAREFAEPLDDLAVQAVLDFSEAMCLIVTSQFIAAEQSLARLLGREGADGWVRAFAYARLARVWRLHGRYDRLQAELPGWLITVRDLGQHQCEVELLTEEAVMRAQLGDLAGCRRSVERAEAVWQVPHYSFQHFMIAVAHSWLLLAADDVDAAFALLGETETRVRRRGLMRYGVTAMNLIAQVVLCGLHHAAAHREARENRRLRAGIERLRRSEMVEFQAMGSLFEAGLASLLGEREREVAGWRAAAETFEGLHMQARAAAAKLRLAALGVDGHEALAADAAAYFASVGIEDPERFVRLIAPARLPST